MDIYKTTFKKKIDRLTGENCKSFRKKVNSGGIYNHKTIILAGPIWQENKKQKIFRLDVLCNKGSINHKEIKSNLRNLENKKKRSLKFKQKSNGINTSAKQVELP